MKTGKTDIQIGMYDNAVMISTRYRLPVRFLSIDIGSDQEGHMSTFVRARIDGALFEANLVGRWSERDADFAELLDRVANLVSFVHRHPVCC